jgi:endonuclease/exonuclease/phosphatase family metal-dependent hydrolase
LPDVWTFAAGPWQSLPIAEIADGVARSVTWRLVGNHEASFTINGDEAAYRALGTKLGPTPTVKAQPPQVTTLGVRFAYGNMQGPYKTSDTTRMAQIPYQVDLVRGAMACDIFAAVELHEENNMDDYFLTQLKAKDSNWSECQGKGGNQLLLRPTLYSAKAKNVQMPGDRWMTDFTVTHKTSGYVFNIVVTHFRSNDDDGTKRDREREAEAKFVAKYVLNMKRTIVVGDFNWKHATEKELRGILATSGFRGLQTRVPGIAEGDKDSSGGDDNKNDGLWIDDILTRADQVVTSAAGIPAGQASDHYLWDRATVFFTDVPVSPGTSAVTPQVGEGGIAEMMWDLWVLRNGSPLFRGRIGPSSDTGDDDGNLSSTFSAADYRELLNRRLLFEGDKVDFVTYEQSDIAWSLISSTQAKAGGNLGIVRGAGKVTGVKRDRSTYAPGDSIGATINLLSQVANGFDWDIQPNLTDTSMTFDVFYPSRGADRSVVLDYGGRVVSFNRQVDPGTFGNAVRGTGDETLTPVRQEAAGLATDPAGRWDLQYADDAVKVAQTLTDKTAQALADGQYVQPSWTVTLAPGTWNGPSDFWLGDQVTLVVKAGRLNVVESLRVVEIGLSIDENNLDTLTVTLGVPDPKHRRTARTINRRLTALERR